MSLPIRVNGYSSYKETNGLLSLNRTATLCPRIKKIVKHVCCRLRTKDALEEAVYIKVPGVLVILPVIRHPTPT